MSLIFILCLSGCNNQSNKVNINFIFEDESKVVSIDKGDIITNDIIPWQDNINNIEIYYDDKKIEKYNNEPIIEDIIIYIKEKDNTPKIITDEQIKQDYLAYSHSKGDTYLTIEDIEILNHYGQYGDIVILRMFRGAYQVVTYISFYELNIQFVFGDRNTPLVYKNGNFYELYDAYKNGIITKEHVISLNEKINNKNNNNQ